MGDATAAVLIYFAVLAVLILGTGFVVTKFNYGQLKTDEVIIAIIVWPFLMFALPVFCLMRSIYKAGAWIAGKI